MELPKAVLDKAKNLIDVYGNNVLYIGKFDNKDVFRFQFPDKERTGFPYVYLYDRYTDTAEEVTGKRVLKLLRKLPI